MSILSELKKRGGPRVRILAERSGQSRSGGEAVTLLLHPPRSRPIDDHFEIARLLVRSGVAKRTAMKVLAELAAGKISSVEAPSVRDFGRLAEEIAKLGVTTYRTVKRKVNVRALRKRICISQEAFAARYGLDVATVQNWEQERTTPDGPAAALLQAIDKDPEKVAELMTR